MTRMFIADRRDLLGGRLLPILNGLRLARATGGEFRMTWFTGHDEFQSMVAGLREVFAGPMVTQEPDGWLIGIDDPRLGAGSRAITAHGYPDSDLTGVGDFYVTPDDADIQILDRRFSLYAVSTAETLGDVRRGLGDVWDSLPLSSEIQRVRAGLQAALAGRRCSSLHARRVHLNADTTLQINRFDSYLSAPAYVDIARHVLQEADTLLVASDSLAFVDEIKAAVGERVLCLTDVMDVSGLTGLQRAMADMMFLSFGHQICGPLSAYGMVASIMGRGRYVNAIRYAARHDLASDHDLTGAIGFTRSLDGHEFRRTWSADDATVMSHRAEVLGDTLLGLRATVQRMAAFSHPAQACDWTHFISRARQIAVKSRQGDIDQALQRLEAILRGEDGQVVVNDVVLSPAMALIRLAGQIALADRQVEHDPAGYDMVIALCHQHGINPRGLHLRQVMAWMARGERDAACAAARRAIAADDTHAGSWCVLAEILEAMGQYDEAAQAIDRACTLDVDNARFWHFGARIKAAAGQTQEALQSAWMAHRTEPDNETYRLNPVTG